jgi:hypothetical protein
VLIDLGFILGYGLLLVGVCGRLSERFERRGSTRTAAVAALLAWAALTAAAVNGLQKIVLWLEVHGQIAQPLPALAAACAGITFALAIPAALFAVSGAVALQRLPSSEEAGGPAR